MIHFIKKYYIILSIILCISSYTTYLAISLFITSYTLENDPQYNPLAGGTAKVSIFMGNVGDKGKCDSLAQVKRGVAEGDLPNNALLSLFQGAVYSEETVIQSSFKGYEQIYNGLKIDNGVAFVNFKSDVIDPNSAYFKDFTKVCAVSQLNQIVFTLKQFKEIQNVVIAIDGSPRKFMQARQFNCDLMENQVKLEKECLIKIP